MYYFDNGKQYRNFRKILIDKGFLFQERKDIKLSNQYAYFVRNLFTNDYFSIILEITNIRAAHYGLVLNRKDPYNRSSK
jgi:hypothetical protein